MVATYSYPATEPFVDTRALGQTSAQAVPTLIRALSSLEELNKRLYSLNGSEHDLATTVGGPFPVNPSAKSAITDAPQAVVERLNDMICEAHATVSNIEASHAAMRRALGT